MPVRSTVALWYWCWCAGSMWSAVALANDIDFNRDVQPILADNCFYCHGPDENQRDSPLRLDIKEGAFADLGGYHAIEPGDPDSSELVRRILSTDPDDMMPPPDHRKKLTDAQKQIIAQWIRQGANWSEHWSLTPIKAYPTPSVSEQQWPVNFIDHFILAELDRQQIKPSPPAEPQTLLRRACFDLTGLPPSSDQQNRFLGNTSDSAYEQLVDQLIASPHFGERLAVYWLDLVRYADSVGYHGDQPVSVSPYRDYIIQAFNDNMPFDQFTREQLAGDLLPNPTDTQLIASGYNRLGMMSAEGGVQPEEYLAKYAADRVRTTATVWLGVTLGCAECHDHKFDPYSTKDFYRFAAFFADIKERGLYSGANDSGNWGPSIEVRDPELKSLTEPIDAEIAELRHSMRDTPEVVTAREHWESEMGEKKIAWKTLQPVDARATREVQLAINEDGVVLAGGNNPDKTVYVVTVDNSIANAAGFRLEALPDASLPKNGPGRASNGNFVVTELITLDGDYLDRIDELKGVYVSWPGELKAKVIQLTGATATVEQTQSSGKHPDKKWSAASAIDHDDHGSDWGWAILPEAGQAHELVVQTVGNQSFGSVLTFVIQQHHGGGSHTLGKFRLSATTDANPVSDPLRGLPVDVREILNRTNPQRNEAQQARLAEYYRDIAPEFTETNQKLAALESKRKQTVNAHTRTSLITVATQPRTIRVLPRGNWMDSSGAIVEPGVPGFFRQIQIDRRPTRLDLADWISAPDNPLAARVLVNRLWKLFFGEGLSSVLDDLGSQGQSPTHPQLLDRLAAELIDSGWDIKQVVKLIVMSQTYRQSSRLRADLRKIDPRNRLLARQSRFRLDAEFIRDNALAVSELLNPQIGGRSVKPYQPPGLYRHLNFPPREYQADTGDAQYRRGLYTHWQRQYLHPAMKTFNAPAREACTASRPRSNTPLAALLLLNDPSYIEAAKVFAENAIAARAEVNERVQWLFLEAFARPPTEEEANIVAGLVKDHQTYYSQHPDQATLLLQAGQSGLPDDCEPSSLAAWISATRAIMNMHEFVTRN